MKPSSNLSSWISQPFNFLFLLVAFNFSVGRAEKAAHFEFQIIEEFHGTPPARELIDSRGFVIPFQTNVTGFITNFTFDIFCAPVGSKKVALELQIFTIGELQHFSILDTLKWGQSLNLPGIPLKGQSTLQLTLIPTPAETTFECQLSSLDTAQWYAEASGHFIFYFILLSLGDFHLPRWRENFEEGLRILQRNFDFHTALPVRFYFFPCQSGQLVWDRRFPFAIDPLRHRICAVHQPRKSGVDPFVVNLERMYLRWGYAPPLLVEGLAGYLDYSHYYVKKAREAGQFIPLGRLLKSKDYYAQSYALAPLEGASFTRYLVKTYGGNLFRQFYADATDLTLDITALKIYGQGLDSLERKWQYYLDTLKIDLGEVEYFATRALDFGHYEDALDLFKVAAALDSSVAFYHSNLGFLYYLAGRYLEAIEEFRKVLESDDSTDNQIVVANFYLLIDQLDSALALYQQAMQRDSTNGEPYVRLGTYFVEAGNDSLGEFYLREANKRRMNLSAQIEMLIGQGKIAKRRGDFDQMAVSLNSAWGVLRSLRFQDPGNPLNYYFLGEMFLTKGFADSAITNLQIAQFVEERPYFLGRIALALGNAYDLKKMRKEALAAYQTGLSIPCIPFDRRRLEDYLKKPYRQ